MHVRPRWGQNFLVNQGAADRIVLAFRPRPSDLVLEVGPGKGVLTRRLAGRVERLVAVEIDRNLARDLQRDLSEAGGAEIVEADILDLDLEELFEGIGATPERRARAIANLPYSVATAVILRLLAQRALLSDILVLIQREVAARIASPPGTKEYGSLSVLCQARARVESVLRLKAGSFRPIPRVESELVRLTLLSPRPEEDIGGAQEKGALESLLRTAFAHRRKTLLNNLARLPGKGEASLGPEGALDLILRAGLDPGSRPENVSVEGFLSLLRARGPVYSAP
jgi:16S rRNA (adenine1518-N6/adenine1519-N6)-dimethyltransferase